MAVSLQVIRARFAATRAQLEAAPAHRPRHPWALLIHELERSELRQLRMVAPRLRYWPTAG